MDENLIAPCGLNCGVCRYYLQRQNGTYKSKNSGCSSCRVKDRGCALSKCDPLVAKTVRFCFECPDYPCDTSIKLEKRYSKKYHVSLRENLAHIETDGIGSFVRSEEEKWRCHACGGTLSVHTGTCIDCGKSADQT